MWQHNFLGHIFVVHYKEVALATGVKRKALTKYLTGYAEAETQWVSGIEEQYDHVLIIPAFDESFSALSGLINRTYDGAKILFIAVVNCPEQNDGHQLQATQRTIELWQQLCSSMDKTWERENLFYANTPVGHGLIAVDRCRDGKRIPKKQGVGLARKIGADIGCRLISEGTVQSPWIHSTDADVCLPESYFTGPQALLHEKTGQSETALVYPFEHHPVPGYELACGLYDLSLRYYVESLQWAGSHYAYHTIGSLIAVHYEAYAKVRGFPKKSGGEDFYLLNKLAKVGRVTSLTAPIVSVSARPSHRVPFGTGPALKKIVDVGDGINAYPFYHPTIFKHLNVVMTLLSHTWHAAQQPAIDCTADIFSVAMSVRGELSDGVTASNGLPTITEPVIAALESVGFLAAWKHAVAHSNNQSQFHKHLIIWFDAFITLKFVHFLRDNHYPSITLRELAQYAEYLSPDGHNRINTLLSMSL